MVSLSGVTAAQATLAPVRSLGQTNTVTASSLVTDQSSAQQATLGVTRATQQLSADQQPRGSPASIAADQEAVKLAQEAAQQASARLNADRAQSPLVNVLA